ncbi:PH domain-containing protein [Hirsutella rhossiliensis]|uniref:PH domain-containing protein n=1 Tax=Hirsutella rhossiliensis TaxID=111463 RepID=A0A9P8MSN0_9HYPO|nr:PH domain-containing protein [Hirsutella rhossiliensis]KAH0960550.1 PH domain-containing protein [Hirsutella rhossiliensis]
MASLVAKVVSKKILGEGLQNKFGTEDPYFEHVPATRLDGRPTGKFKKRKKALPPGISEHDGKVLTKVKRRAYRLDLALCSFLGIRFGWGSVIGLVPAIGDALDTFMALMVFKTCCQVEGGLPNATKMYMIFNIALDFGIGLVPFLGDLADAAFKANSRNALLLEQHLREKGKKELRKSEEARVRGGGGGWFGRNQTRPHDIERGPDDDRHARAPATKGQRRGAR